MSLVCLVNAALVWIGMIGWSVTLWRWRSCARALHQCQAQRAKLEWKLSLYRKHCEKWVGQ